MRRVWGRVHVWADRTRHRLVAHYDELSSQKRKPVNWVGVILGRGTLAWFGSLYALALAGARWLWMAV